MSNSYHFCLGKSCLEADKVIVNPLTNQPPTITPPLQTSKMQESAAI